MLNLIDEFWYGNIKPAKESGINNQELKNLENLITRNHELLSEQIENRAIERFEKYNDCVKEYISLVEKLAFGKGFSLGLRMSAEAILSSEPNA